MAQLFTKVKLYLEANGKTENEIGAFSETSSVLLRNDSIDRWEVSGLARPTDEQLNALESQADELEALNQVYANRQSEYPSIQDLVVALYDTDDKSAIEAKRAEVKLKYPKP